MGGFRIGIFGGLADRTSRDWHSEFTSWADLNTFELERQSCASHGFAWVRPFNSMLRCCNAAIVAPSASNRSSASWHHHPWHADFHIFTILYISFHFTDLSRCLNCCKCWKHAYIWDHFKDSAFQAYIPWPMTTDYVSVCNVQQTYQF